MFIKTWTFKRGKSILPSPFLCFPKPFPSLSLSTPKHTLKEHDPNPNLVVLN